MLVPGKRDFFYLTRRKLSATLTSRCRRVPAILSGTFVTGQHSYEQESGGELDFARLVDLHYAPLYRFALSLAKTESDASDLVQETFRIWATKGHQLQEPSKVKAWLFTSLHRLFLETQRKLTRFPHCDIEDASDELPVIDPALVDRLDGQGLVALLARVDPQFQAPVALFYLEDYSYQEIAGIVGVPLGTVKSRIARGLAQLKQLLLQAEQRSPSARKDFK